MPSDLHGAAGPAPCTTIEIDATHPTLDHHRPGGLPLFGTAMSINVLAGAARQLGLSASTCTLRAVEVFKPCILDEGARHLLVARFSGSPDSRSGEIASLTDDGDALVHLRAGLPGAPVVFAGLARDVVEAAGEPGPSVAADEIYRLFFHGPSFRVVARAQPWGGALRTYLATHAEIANVPPLARLVEFGLQTAGLLELATSGRMMIPHAVARISAGALDGHALDGCTAIARFSGDACDIDVLGAGGVRLMAIRGYRTVPLPFPADAAATSRLAQRFGFRGGAG